MTQRLHPQDLRAIVAAIWLFLAYVVIDHIGQQIEFYRAMGGVMK